MAMTFGESFKLKVWISILKDISLYYKGKTIENIIYQLESRVKELDKKNS